MWLMPITVCSSGIPRPMLSTKRPPVRLCMVRANPAVTSGWRVLLLVTPVEMVIVSDTAAAAPHCAATSFFL